MYMRISMVRGKQLTCLGVISVRLDLDSLVITLANEETLVVEFNNVESAKVNYWNLVDTGYLNISERNSDIKDYTIY